MKLFEAAAALALVAAMAMPAGAADTRAVRSKVSPIYPEVAKRMKVGGEVRVEATVDAQGRVTEVKAISGNHMLTIAAEDAVRKWRFEPGPGDTTVSVEINFTVNP
jgi:TonB family protein